MKGVSDQILWWGYYWVNRLMVLGYLRGEREPIFNQSKKLFFLHFFKVALEKKKKGKLDYIKRKKKVIKLNGLVRIIEKEQIKRMR